ncbi:MAG TPA: NTP transferase domain-containing protein [Thermoplasmata archaeon]|nr:NTP transferase domain-containing protein [Thermoplasmata archaeon]
MERVPSAPLALILAAGASTRFGSQPKALLSVAGEPAIARLVRISREEGYAPRVVVGAHADPLRAALPSPKPEVLENTEWAQGRTGSIQRGLDGVGKETPVLLWPVDHPFVQAMTLRRLRTAAEHDAMGVWFIPTFEGLGGHPVLLGPVVCQRIADLRPAEPLRTLLPAFGPQVVRVPVKDPGVRANVDTPQDYHRYESLARREEERS